MKKIIFVDDEPKILEGLRRMLRFKRNEWDMTFLEGGAEAMETLSKEPCDVIVSDIVKRDLTIADIIENGDNSELISTGSSGKGVEQIQQILVDNGYDLGTFGDKGNGVDGKFGSMTKSAIKKLQRDYDLQVDGIVGIETSNKLNELIK